MTIAAGQLREYVVIQRPSYTELPDGSTSVSYTDLLQTYCHVEQKNASIDVVASQDNLAQVMVFKMRYRTDPVFVIGDRVVWRERNFKIHSFSWDMLRTVLTIICQTHNESTSDGNPGS